MNGTCHDNYEKMKKTKLRLGERDEEDQSEAVSLKDEEDQSQTVFGR